MVPYVVMPNGVVRYRKPDLRELGAKLHFRWFSTAMALTEPCDHVWGLVPGPGLQPICCEKCGAAG